MAKIIKHPHSYIGYGYFITYDGIIHQGRMDTEEQAHTISTLRPGYYNKNSIGICLQGNFEIEQPTENQLKSLKKLIDKLRTKYNIPNTKIIGHREVSKTNCPGQNLFKWLIQNYPN